MDSELVIYWLLSLYKIILLAVFSEWTDDQKLVCHDFKAFDHDISFTMVDTYPVVYGCKQYL